jgi:hypothetical protein
MLVRAYRLVSPSREGRALPSSGAVPGPRHTISSGGSEPTGRSVRPGRPRLNGSALPFPEQEGRQRPRVCLCLAT